MEKNMSSDFTGHFGSVGTIRSVSLSCENIPFLDTSGSKSTFLEKLFFPLIDNKVSSQDMGFFWTAVPLKFKGFYSGFTHSRLTWKSFIFQEQVYSCGYTINSYQFTKIDNKCGDF